MVSLCFEDFLVYVFFFNGFVTLRIILFAQLLFFYDFLMIFYIIVTIRLQKQMQNWRWQGKAGGGGGQWAGLWVADGWRDREFGWVGGG